MIDVGTAVGYIMLDTNGFTKGVKEAKTAFKDLVDSNKSMSDKLMGSSKLFTSVGSSLTKSLTLPIIGLGTASVVAASDFEGAFKKLISSTGAAGKEVEKFEKVLRNVYKAGYGESYEDVADAIALISQQLKGLSDEELQEVTESALLLRDTFDYDVSESVRSIDTLMSNFGLTSQQAFDYIVYGAQNGLDYSNELLDTINEYSPQFKMLGLSAQDMFNIFTSGAAAGAWNLDKIGDAVKELGIRVKENSDESRNALFDLGLNVDTITSSFAAGGNKASEAFESIIRGLRTIEDPLEQNRIGVQLFGTMWEDLGPQVITQLDAIKDSANGVNGSMDELKQQKLDDFNMQLEQTKRQAQDVGVEIGLQLMPYVQSFLQLIQDLVGWFANLDDGTKSFIETIVLVAAVVGPVLLVLGKLAMAITAISGALTALGISGSISLPIILAVVAALAILFALIIAIKSGSKDVKNPVDDIKDQYPQIPSSRSSGSYASGLDYVPSDRTVNVHEGERIMTKQENEEYTKSKNRMSYDRPMNFNFTVELDGDVLAQKQYRRNGEQQNLHGVEMIN